MALTDKDEIYIKLVDACLENYLIFGSKQRLLDALVLAQQLWFIYEALAQYRLRAACDKTRFLAVQRRGRLSNSLQEFSSLCAGLAEP